MKRRVAVTGLGIISPCGNTIDAFSVNLMAGKSGVRRISSAFSNLLSVKIAAEVDFNPFDYFTNRQMSAMDRVNQFALAAASQAWKDSGPALSMRKRKSGRAYISVQLWVGEIPSSICTINLFKHNAYRVNHSRCSWL
jgi:3-oxoacyl-[acyl-carrier-protein] synthase II